MRNSWVTFAGYLLVLVLLSLLLPSAQDNYYSKIAMSAGIAVTLGVSLNIVNGFTGQFSIGHAGFMAIGAYQAAALAAWADQAQPLGLTGSPAGQQLLIGVSVVLSGASAAVAGFLVGLPSLRLRGDYLAIATLGFGEIIRVMVENAEWLGGSRGFSMPPSAAPVDLLWIWGIAGVTVLTSARLKTSTQGRAMLAVREDEIAAEAMGVNTTQEKVRAFVVAAFFAGVAGALFAHLELYLNPKSFTFMRSIEVVAMVVLGGMGSISGAVLAAIFLSILPEALRPVQDLTGFDLRMVLYGLLLIIVPIKRPSGLFGQAEIGLFRPARRARASRGAS
ncbi:MAG: branched-chain amino acid ABC transporter permease [Deltaproteobacteria bacterium]|nr:branched-chain amino acid ABC transporter permease [Deltaproteobacteria bacterium]